MNEKEQRPDINPCMYGQLINKDTKNTQQKKDKQMVLRKLYSLTQINGIESLSTPYRKIDQNWIKGLSL